MYSSYPGRFCRIPRQLSLQKKLTLLKKTCPTDNATCFVLQEFQNFLSEYGVAHSRITPLWPQANGEVERQNRSLLKTIKIAQLESKIWRLEISKFLTAYRATQPITIAVSPYYLMFGLSMRTKLPMISSQPQLL